MIFIWCGTWAVLRAILNFGGDFQFQQKLGTKTYHGGKPVWTWKEVLVYLWELVLLEGFPGLRGSVAGMFSARFPVRWLCCGSLWLWETRYGYQGFFISVGEYVGQIKGIKRKQVERGEINFPNLCYGARGNAGLWNGSTLTWTKTSSEM